MKPLFPAKRVKWLPPKIANSFFDNTFLKSIYSITIDERNE